MQRTQNRESGNEKERENERQSAVASGEDKMEMVPESRINHLTNHLSGHRWGSEICRPRKPARKGDLRMTGTVTHSGLDHYPRTLADVQLCRMCGQMAFDKEHRPCNTNVIEFIRASPSISILYVTQRVAWQCNMPRIWYSIMLITNRLLWQENTFSLVLPWTIFF